MSTVDSVAHDDWEERVVGSRGLVLVDVWAPWCIPCRRVEPMVADIAERHGDRVTCLRLNADEAPDLIAAHTVLTLPTILLFRDGTEAARVAGVPKRGRLAATVDELLAAESAAG